MLRFKTHLVVGFTLFALAACGGSSSPVDRANGGEDEDPPTGSTTHHDAGTGVVAKDGGTKKGDAATTTDKGDPPVTGNIPCDVQPLVIAKCGPCHGAKPTGGAPMSLVTLADFHAAAKTDATRKVYDLAGERMTETDPTLRMPPTSITISSAETKTLTTWLAGGATGNSDDCSVSTPDAGTVVVDPNGTPADAHSGGISTTPLIYDDPDIKCYPFTAFAKSLDHTKPYQVPTTPDYYVEFLFKPPFTGTQYLKYFKTKIDNAAVLHHWLFYMQTSGGAESVTENAIGAHPSGDLIAGWAPGGSDMYFDADTGMALSGSVNYMIETHYNNKTGAVAPDASGLELCVTPHKPTNVAALAWLGTDSISGTSATGVCRPSNTGPVHLIAGSPHMHLKGRHMKVVLTRKDGSTQTIHDDDFDFQYQRQYVEDVIINPGDSVATTCTYSAPARFGKSTNDEMCYFFSTHWPAGGLTMLGSGTVIHGGNSCLP